MKGSSNAAKLSMFVMALFATGCQVGSPASETTASRSPAHAAASIARPSGPAETSKFVLSDPSEGWTGITVDVPETGWTGGHWAMEWGPDGFDRPLGAGIIAFVADRKFYVFGDPCDWKSTKPETPATTVDEIIAALAKQSSRDPSAPERITVGGYPGKEITLHVPDDARPKDCDGTTFSTLGVAGENQALFAQGRGEIDEIWIVDVGGSIVLLEGGYYADTSQQTVDELHAILNSATFEPASTAAGSLAYSLDGDIYVADPDGSNAVKIADGASGKDCEAGRTGGGSIPQRWMVKPGSYREAVS